MLLTMPEELKHSDKHNIKISRQQSTVLETTICMKLLRALVKRSYPPALQPVPPGCNFPETGRFNAAVVKITPWILAAETVMTACSPGLLY